MREIRGYQQHIELHKLFSRALKRYKQEHDPEANSEITMSDIDNRIVDADRRRFEKALTKDESLSFQSDAFKEAVNTIVEQIGIINNARMMDSFYEFLENIAPYIDIYAGKGLTENEFTQMSQNIFDNFSIQQHAENTRNKEASSFYFICFFLVLFFVVIFVVGVVELVISSMVVGECLVILAGIMFCPICLYVCAHIDTSVVPIVDSNQVREVIEKNMRIIFDDCQRKNYDFYNTGALDSLSTKPANTFYELAIKLAVCFCYSDRAVVIQKIQTILNDFYRSDLDTASQLLFKKMLKNNDCSKFVDFMNRLFSVTFPVNLTIEWSLATIPAINPKHAKEVFCDAVANLRNEKGFSRWENFSSEVENQSSRVMADPITSNMNLPRNFIIVDDKNVTSLHRSPSAFFAAGVSALLDKNSPTFLTNIPEI